MKTYMQLILVCLVVLGAIGSIRVGAAPTLQVLSPAPGSTVATLSQIVVSFSEPVTGLDAFDLLINGEPAVDVEVSGSSVYTFTCTTPLPGFVSVYFDVDHGITDLAANAFDQTAPGATWSYTVADSVPPIAIRLSPPPNAVVRSVASAEVVFSEPVLGISADDLVINGVAATNVAGAGAGPYRFSFAAPTGGTVSFAWANGANIRDQHDNPFGGGSWSVILNPSAPATVSINEFLADNESSTGLRDEDNELHDWIEFYNYGTEQVNLAGWSLANEANIPRQWVFPPVTLGPGQYVVVFASGKNRAGVRLHSNFQLGSAGEYLALYTSDEPAVAASAFNYPEQRINHSYGVTAGGLRYFSTPTPSAPNGASSLTNIAQPVHFSVERGFFNASFNLVLSTLTHAASMRYTLDGSLPTAESGLLYSGPITVSNTTPVRAAAFSTNTVPSLVRTHTYIFPEQVLRQPNGPSGFPSSWVTQSGSVIVPADYAMDPRVINNPAYSSLARQGLTAIPTLSVVMRTSDLFSQANGIYSNPRGTGLLWERPASAEFIFNDGTDSAQIDAGYRIQGGSSREENKDHKHSQRLLFRGSYGAGKFEHRLFRDSAVESFDSLVVDAGLNLVWTHRTDAGQRRQAQYVRDQFMSDLHNAMGWPAFHGRFFHLYLNGLYWGLHGIHERPEEDFAASYFGGTENDWDILKNTTAFEVLSGDLTAWNAMRSLANSGLANASQYQQIQQYLDVDSLIDYMILNIYGGNTDWPHHNWYAGRRRNPAGTFKFFNWDAEHVLKATSDNRSAVADANTPAEFYDHLRRNNAEFRLRFADHVHKHFFNDGLCTSNQALARYVARIREIDPAIVLESARWGDNAGNNDRPGQPYERNVEWLAELGRLTNSWFPQRSTIVLNQFRGLGLYPGIVAPTFSQHGGRVPRGFNLTMSAPAGTILFTTNGVDPRVYLAGSPAPGAAIYSNAIQLARSGPVKARALVGTNWSALTEAHFTIAQLTVPLRITEIMYNPVGGDAFEFIELRNVGDTDIDLSGFSFSGITFVFPPGSVLAPGGNLVLASDANPAAFAQRHPGAVVFGYFVDRLANGGERIAIKDLAGETVTSVDYSDGGQWPDLADGAGYSLETIDPAGDPDDVANWRASLAINGSPGVANPGSSAPSVFINELMAINTGAVSNAGTFPTYIELYNSGSASLDLGNWSLSDDSNPRSLVFAAGTVIEPGGYYIVWLGTGFFLNPEGESVFLYDPATNRVDGLSYGLQVANRTVGRLGSSWNLCLPTPGAANVAAALAPASSLAINEWFANSPPGGVDWLEVFNASSNAPASLQDVYLGVGGALYQSRALSFLPPRGHVQLLADELPGVIHLDFKLPAAGGQLALYDGSGVLLDRVTYAAQTEGVSEGRLPDGAAAIQPFPGTASPGAPNYVAAYFGAILNEVMARNVSGVTMSNGLVADWVELYNPAATNVDLSGMVLAIDELNDTWVFPPGSFIAANDYLIVWCTPLRPGSTTFEPELNTSWRIDRAGAIYLLSSQGQILDRIEFGPQVDNYSLGRSGSGWTLLAVPTPGAANSAPAALGAPSTLRINEWMPYALNGDDWFEIFNPAALPVALGGLYVTDNPSISGITNHTIVPYSYVGPGGWVRLYADSDVGAGRDHVNFRLADLGETLRLYDSNFQLIDSIEFGPVPAQLSEGRVPDGDARIVRLPVPTPVAPNVFPLQHVNINELLVNPDAFTEQAIELYNSSSQAIDISHWWLSDSAVVPKKFRIPPGTIISAGGFQVFYEAQFATSNTNIPFLVLGTGQTWLSEADAAGNLSGARAVVDLGPLPFARSYGVTPCTGPGFVALRRPTFGVDEPASVEQFRTGNGAVNALPGPINPEDLPTGAPYISKQPLGRIAIAGASVLLHVGACGDGPLAHQWFFNDAALPNETNSVLQLANVQFANVGDYYAIITNAFGAVTSQVAQITLGTMPVITAHPQNWRTNAGSTVTFSVGAAGPDLTYQWRFNATAIPGATGPVLLLPDVTLADAGYYSVLVGGHAGVVTSQAAELIVTPRLQIFVQPQGRSVLAGSNVLFSVSAQGAGPLSYQWFLNSNAISGATSATLAVTNAQLDDHGSYFVEVTDDNGTVRSASALLVVRVPPAFTAQPVSRTAIEGESVTFAVSVNGTPPLGYRWRRNGISLVTKIDDPTLTITNVQLSHAGTYNVIVTNMVNPAPGIISSDATLTVLLRPTLLQPRLLVSGGFEATLRGSTGRTHTVSRSADLINWSDFHTFIGTNSETVITDPSPGSNRFYRARLLP
jgi:hypothetical protein